MHRSRSSISFDILHGIDSSANLSTILAYLNYFPPPPPVIPGPPPQRSWTCSTRSLSSLSCLVSDDLNPSSIRTNIPLTTNNQTLSFINKTHITKLNEPNLKALTVYDFLRNHLTFILTFIIFLSIFIIILLFLLLFIFIYIRYNRQKRSRLTHHHERNNSFELKSTNSYNNNNKKKKVYDRLIPHDKKSPKYSTVLSRNFNDANDYRHSMNHRSSILEDVQVSRIRRIMYTNDHDEHEEVL